MENNTSISDSPQPQPSTSINSRTTSEDVAVDKRGSFQTRYGCLGCRPSCLQFLTGARWFLLFTGLAIFCQAMVVSGFVGATISTIERRFGLSSSQTAWIPATYDIAGAPVMLVIGYLGLTLRRPVWIGGGLIMVGIGFVVYTIPHFVASPYRYSDSGDFSNLCVQTAWNSSTNDSLPAIDRYMYYLQCLQLT